MSTQVESPAYSIGELNGKIGVKIDSGKFMDSRYFYETFEVENTPAGPVMKYKVVLQMVIVNGVLRDKLELENQFPEVLQEFNDTVATPIVTDLIKMIHEGTTPTTEHPEPSRIILS